VRVQDLDDALHCNLLPGGEVEIGIHIADLGEYLKPGGLLDDYAAARATTTYLPTSNFPMVPRLLSEKVCSLVPGSDKNCFRRGHGRASRAAGGGGS
jgi:exosome complex exonuclease DIS3/RRP44